MGKWREGRRDGDAYPLVNLELIKSSLLARERIFESMNKRTAQAEGEGGDGDSIEQGKEIEPELLKR